MSSSSSSPSLARLILLALVVAVVGIYVLYDWYSGQLKTQISQLERGVEDAVAQIKDREQQMIPIQGEVTQLKANIEELNARHEQEKQQLQDQLAAAAQDKSRLEEAMSELRQTDAGALAAEQAKTAAVREERDRGIAAFEALHGQYQAALAKAEGLQSELNGLKQVIADSAMEHREQIEALERHLNERVKLAKATPKDSELMRAAQKAGLLPEAVALDEETAAFCSQLAETSASTQTSLDALQAELAIAREEHAKQVAGLEAELSTARAALAQPSQPAESTQEVSAIQERLAQTESELEAAKAQAATALAQAQADLARQIEDGEAKIAELTEQLEREQAGRAKVSEVKDALVVELNAALDSAKTELAALQAELRAAQQSATQSGAKALDDAQARIATLEAAIAEERAKSQGIESTISDAAEQAKLAVRGLYQRFAELGGTHTDRGVLLKLADAELRFEPAKTTLTDNDLPSLDRLAGLLAEHPDLNVRIEGYTDALGDEQVNLTLSRERAEAVKQALVARGVKPERVTAEGMGPERPIADNATSAGRAQNRRVEVYIVEG